MRSILPHSDSRATPISPSQFEWKIGLHWANTRPARGAGTLIPSAQHLVWAAKQPLGTGALRYRAWAHSWSSAALAARSVLPSYRPATPLFSPACWEPGFQARAQSTCPELSAQGLVPLRWGCALPSPNAPGKAPNHIHPGPRFDAGYRKLLDTSPVAE